MLEFRIPTQLEIGLKTEIGGRAYTTPYMGPWRRGPITHVLLSNRPCDPCDAVIILGNRSSDPWKFAATNPHLYLPTPPTQSSRPDTGRWQQIPCPAGRILAAGNPAAGSSTRHIRPEIRYTRSTVETGWNPVSGINPVAGTNPVAGRLKKRNPD